MSKPWSSIVVPTYQRCASVQRLLAALAQQTAAPNEFELVVSVDGSDDGTRELLSQTRTAFALNALWQPNRGRAAACNAGIREARGELIILLDDDMEPLPEFIAAHQCPHAECKNLAVMGAAPIPVEPSSAPIVKYIGAKFSDHLQRLAEPARPLKPRDFYSGNFSIRREWLLRIGAFDEAFRVYGNEDVELYLRLARVGMRFAYSDAAKAVQHYDKNFTRLARDHIGKGQTSVQLARRHPDIIAELKLSQYPAVSRQWRLARGTMLATTRVFPAMSARVIDAVLRLESRAPKWLPLVYQFTLDYFYWLGVQVARESERRVAARMKRLAHSRGKS